MTDFFSRITQYKFTYHNLVYYHYVHIQKQYSPRVQRLKFAYELDRSREGNGDSGGGGGGGDQELDLGGNEWRYRYT